MESSYSLKCGYGTSYKVHLTNIPKYSISWFNILKYICAEVDKTKGIFVFGITIWTVKVIILVSQQWLGIRSVDLNVTDN